MVIDNDSIQVVLSWSTVGGIAAWLIHEFRKDYKGVKTELHGKVDKTACHDIRQDCKDAHRNEILIETGKEDRHALDK